MALGGSFDQLHNGHRNLLTYAAQACQHTLVVGITGDEMLHKKQHADIILPYDQRAEDVRLFMNTVFSVTSNFRSQRDAPEADCTLPVSSSTQQQQQRQQQLTARLHLDIHQLQEPFGPAIVDPDIDAIAVSSETFTGACKINEIRQAKGMRCLDILVLRRTDNAILSSSFIRDRIIAQQRQ